MQFIVGDRVVLKSMSGSTLVVGVVESISPMRTCILTDKKKAVFINNKDVSAKRGSGAGLPGGGPSSGFLPDPPACVA